MRVLKLLLSPIALLAIFTLVIAITSCGLFSDGDDQSGSSGGAIQGLPEDFELLAEVWSVLNDRHLNRDDFDSQEFARDAIRGMLDATGTPHDAFLTPDQHDAQFEDFSGRFSGIGVEVTMRDGRPTVLNAIPDTPAEEAGLRPGDVILAIDGESTEGFSSIFDAVFKIRGQEGTPVDLLILHSSGGEPLSATIVRGEIEVKSVNFRSLVVRGLAGGIGHLQISSFTGSTEREVIEAIETFKRRDNRGLILDVRNNLGGVVSTTVGVASQFLDDGLVLYEIDGDGKRRDWKVRSGGIAKEIPMVVLMNEFSASSSEILAGALIDHQRATTIGTTTFGKGTVNILWELSDGSGLFVSIATFFTPNGTQIEGEGLEPDIIVEASSGDSSDPQMDRAIEILKELVEGA